MDFCFEIIIIRCLILAFGMYQSLLCLFILEWITLLGFFLLLLTEYMRKNFLVPFTSALIMVKREALKNYFFASLSAIAVI